MMFGSKKRRIADLTEDLATLRTKYETLKHQFAEIEKQRDSWKWQAERTAPGQADALIARTRERDAAVRELAAAEKIIITLRQRLTAPDAWMKVKDALAALARSDRYHAAWQSAYERARRCKAELDQQQDVVRRQTEQLFDAIGYQPDERALLQAVRPTPAVTAGEVTAP